MSLPIEGILLVNKPKGKTSFSLVAALRKIFGVKKIGHAGTLDPLAQGVMVLLIGKKYTRMSDQFLCNHKEYIAQIILGASTETYDAEGPILSRSDKVCSLQEVQERIASAFQGEIEQVPPMFSAKKIKGKKLYELARKGIEVERQAAKIVVKTEILSYEYPHLVLKIACSKGTYIRSIAHDLGQLLGCGAYLNELQRTQSGHFNLRDCVDGALIFNQNENTQHLLRQSLLAEAKKSM